MKTSSSIVTPSHMKVWLEILQFLPIFAPFCTSTKVPIFVLSPISQPYRFTKSEIFTPTPSFTSGVIFCNTEDSTFMKGPLDTYFWRAVPARLASSGKRRFLTQIEGDLHLGAIVLQGTGRGPEDLNHPQPVQSARLGG